MDYQAKKLVVLCLSAAMVGACGGDAAQEAAEEAPVVSEGTAPVATAPAVGLLNPNLVGDAELGAVGLPAAAVEAVMANRPFANMLALDAALAGHLDEAAREAAYASVWIPLNLNAASEEEILLVPGVGDRMAHEFEEYRPYAAMAEFNREIGKYVDDTEVERLAQYVFVPIDLNSATRDEILAVPGVGERMAHEFEEYRPYSSIEQFRREIGKYVDDAEVARLERYVVIH